MKTNTLWRIRNNLSQRARFYAQQRECSLPAAWLRAVLLKPFRLELPFLEYSVTSCCTLRCRDCSNLIPSVQPGTMLSFREFCEEVEKLLKCVDYIYRFKLHGGEPFLNPALPDMIDHIRQSDKIGEIRLSTNGTVRPGEKLLRALRDSNALVFLSDYGPAVAPDRDEILRILLGAGVRVRDLKGQVWADLGGIQPHGYSPREMRRLIFHCGMANCKAYGGGAVYLCSRCANADMAGLFAVPEKVTIDCGHIKKTRRALRRLYGLTACAGCDRCAGVLLGAPPLTPGVQLEQKGGRVREHGSLQ